jgi:hypothetical protein
MFRGPSTETDMDRIGEILQYVDSPGSSSKVFSDQIKMALEDSNIYNLSCFGACVCVCVCVCVRVCAADDDDDAHEDIHGMVYDAVILC